HGGETRRTHAALVSNKSPEHALTHETVGKSKTRTENGARRDHAGNRSHGKRNHAAADTEHDADRPRADHATRPEASEVRDEKRGECPGCRFDRDHVARAERGEAGQLLQDSRTV